MRTNWYKEQTLCTKISTLYKASSSSGGSHSSLHHLHLLLFIEQRKNYMQVCNCLQVSSSSMHAGHTIWKNCSNCLGDCRSRVCHFYKYSTWADCTVLYTSSWIYMKLLHMENQSLQSTPSNLQLLKVRCCIFHQLTRIGEESPVSVSRLRRLHRVV